MNTEFFIFVFELHHKTSESKLTRSVTGSVSKWFFPSNTPNCDNSLVDFVLRKKFLWEKDRGEEVGLYDLSVFVSSDCMKVSKVANSSIEDQVVDRVDVRYKVFKKSFLLKVSLKVLDTIYRIFASPASNNTMLYAQKITKSFSDTAWGSSDEKGGIIWLLRGQSY